MIKFKDAISKTYTHEFTDKKGIVHKLEACCYSDDDSILDCPATWNVTDEARSDLEVRTHGSDEEFEMGTELDILAEKIVADYDGLNIYFSFADQVFYQA